MSRALAILMPAYNEAAWVERAVERIAGASPPVDPSSGLPVTRTLYACDDGSTDATPAILERLCRRDDPRLAVRLIRHTANRGKGAAVASALRAAMDDGADVLLIHDADLEYDPADHPRLLGPILDGRADAVIGSRFLGESHRVLYFWHAVANRVVTLLSNALTNLNLSDIECCLKAFTAEVAGQLDLRERSFGVEPELIAKLARARVSRPGHAAGPPDGLTPPGTRRPPRPGRGSTRSA
ncbi:MAG: glycosyl transferase [Isosphaera sp.]|nr:glycosyl transferase [Isosphaera sp.]